MPSASEKTARSTPSVQDLRAWAQEPIGGTPMVPLHQDTVRALASEKERREQLLREARDALVPHMAYLVGDGGKRIKNQAAQLVDRLDMELEGS